MKKLLRDPLLHFLTIGLVLFFVYALINQDTNKRAEIIIDYNDIDNYVAKWKMQWNRPPTQEELGNLVAQDIKQEVFYQEALKMNLDHNDEIIKRRLSQKMEFLSNDLASLSEPSDDELETYYKSHSGKYKSTFHFSLYQVVFTYNKHENPNAIINSILSAGNTITFEQMKTKGDKLPLLYYYDNIDSFELSKHLGSSFIENLKDLELNNWVGPISSGFGEHIVFLTNKVEPKLPDLSQVRDVVLQDYLYDKQNELNDLIFKTFKKNYTVKFNFENIENLEDFKSYLETKLSF